MRALERAEKAVWDAVCATNDERSGGYAGTMHQSPHYVDGFIDPAAIARAVLMAVREVDAETWNTAESNLPHNGMWDEIGMSDVWDSTMTAILGEGEGE